MSISPNSCAYRRAVGRVALLACLLYVGGASPLAAAEYYVAPSGQATNNGTKSQPLSLTAALSSTSPARPGDTIWLRGGVYVGAFVSNLRGTQAAPITVRQYPGERATLDGGTRQGEILTVYGQWTIFWGFEITSSSTGRTSQQSGPWPSDLPRGNGIFAYGQNLKFVNLILHDLRSGIGLWAESVGSEAYGNIVYNNGWSGTDRSHGHGIYTQNITGQRLIRENILFNQFSHGVHAYGSEVGPIDYITLEGNVAFNNGILGRTGFERDLLLGGGRIALNPVVNENYTYGGGQSNVGYAAGCSNGTVTANYLMGAGPLILVKCAPLMTDNTIFGIEAQRWGYGTMPSQFPANTYYMKRPTTSVAFVRANAFETGRAHVIIYNWDQRPAVTLDISDSGLSFGDTFEVRDAQNFYAPALVTTVYNGSPVTIPMTGLTLAPPVGNVPTVPAHTGPTFGVFVILRTTPGDPTAPIEMVNLPIITPGGGTFQAPVTVSIDTGTSGATIRYTTNGAPVTSQSPVYARPFVIDATATISARAFKAGMFDSGTASAVLTINIPVPTAPAPSISPAGGSFTGSATVTMASTTPGAEIRYTTDGSTPLATSTRYTAALAFTASATIKARTFATGMTASAVTSASFVITAAPTPPPTPPTPPTHPPAHPPTNPPTNPPHSSSDRTRPVVSGVGVSPIGSTTVTINWQTSERSNSFVRFFGLCPGSTSGYSQCDTPVVAAHVTAHAVVVEDLRPNTVYTAQVWSKDPSGNSGWSQYLTFRTRP